MHFGDLGVVRGASVGRSTTTSTPHPSINCRRQDDLFESHYRPTSRPQAFGFVTVIRQLRTDAPSVPARPMVTV